MVMNALRTIKPARLASLRAPIVSFSPRAFSALGRGCGPPEVEHMPTERHPGEDHAG